MESSALTLPDLHDRLFQQHVDLSLVLLGVHLFAALALMLQSYPDSLGKVNEGQYVTL